MVRHWSEDHAERCRADLLPRSAVLADRDDRNGLAVDDGGVAPAGVMGPVRSHCGDLFAFRDLVRQVRQHGAVSIAAGGEFHRPDVRRGRIHRQMHLAPLATALDAVLAYEPDQKTIRGGLLKKSKNCRIIYEVTQDVDLLPDKTRY